MQKKNKIGRVTQINETKNFALK